MQVIEIPPLLRAWHLTEHRMYSVVGLDTDQETGSVEVFDGWHTDFTSGEKEKQTKYFPIDEVKLLKYTGFTDKYKQPIYTADVLEGYEGQRAMAVEFVDYLHAMSGFTFIPLLREVPPEGNHIDGVYTLFTGNWIRTASIVGSYFQLMDVTGDIDQITFVPQTVVSHAPVAPAERTFSENQVLSVLNRLAYYYTGRVRVALKVARQKDDPGCATEHMLDALQWEAKLRTVYKVAENLEVRIKGREK